jgi:hypothetical protein
MLVWLLLLLLLLQQSMLLPLLVELLELSVTATCLAACAV